jgi:hypothetical protein
MLQLYNSKQLGSEFKILDQRQRLQEHREACPKLPCEKETWHVPQFARPVLAVAMANTPLRGAYEDKAWDVEAIKLSIKAYTQYSPVHLLVVTGTHSQGRKLFILF